MSIRQTREAPRDSMRRLALACPGARRSRAMRMMPGPGAAIVRGMGEDIELGRRRFLGLLLAAPLALAAGVRLLWPDRLAAAPAPATPERKPAFAPTPDCGDEDEPTPAETQGPYY